MQENPGSAGPFDTTKPIVVLGTPALYAGLTATFYMRPDFSPAMNDGICKCIEEYLTLAPGPPLIVAVPNSRQWVNAQKREVETPCELIHRVKPGAEFDLAYGWVPVDTEASPWSVRVVRVDDVSELRLSSFHVTFPLAVGQQPTFVEMIRRWSESLGAYHGSVGFGLIAPLDMSREARMDNVIYEAARLYPGINVDYPTFQASYLINGIKTVDWLTIVGPQLAAKAGGIAALEKQLEKDCRLLSFGQGGVLVQAGQAPALGHDGVPPPLYVKVNKVLRPIRIESYPDCFQSGQYAQPFFDEKASNAWIKRFD